MAVNLDKNEKSPSGGDNKKKFNFNKPDIKPSSKPSESKDGAAEESHSKKASPNFSKSNEGAKSKFDFTKEKIEPQATKAEAKKSSKLPIIITVLAVIIIGIWFLNRSSDNKAVETAQKKPNSENTSKTANPSGIPATETGSSTAPANDTPAPKNEPTTESNSVAPSAPSGSTNTETNNVNQSNSPKKVEVGTSGTTASAPSTSKEADKKPTSKAISADETTKVKDASRPVKAKQSTPATMDLSGSIEEKAKKVIEGMFGNGSERRNALGSEYDAIQAKVNELLNSANN
jgi:hypothetical protein